MFTYTLMKVYQQNKEESYKTNPIKVLSLDSIELPKGVTTTIGCAL